MVAIGYTQFSVYVELYTIHMSVCLSVCCMCECVCVCGDCDGYRHPQKLKLTKKKTRNKFILCAVMDFESNGSGWL